MIKEVRITNLREFRRDLRQAIDATPRELSNALKRAGDPIVKRAGQLAPRRSGRLAKSYRARARGTTGFITSLAPYGAGAEWGVQGRWRGFARHGARGSRFAGRAIDEKADEMLELVFEEIEEIVTIHGWAEEAGVA